MLSEDRGSQLRSKFARVRWSVHLAAATPAAVKSCGANGGVAGTSTPCSGIVRWFLWWIFGAKIGRVI